MRMVKIVRRGKYARMVFRDFKPGEIFDVVKRINEKSKKSKIIRVIDVFTLPDTIAGVVEYGSNTRGTDYPPFIGETVVEEVGGRRVWHYSHLEPLPDGRVAGAVQMEDGSWIFFKGDAIIENIEGKEILNTSEDGFAVLPDGTLTGNIEIACGQAWEAFKGESFIKRIRGKEIERACILQAWCDGTLVGVASLKDERDVPFKGDVLLDEIQGEKVVYVDLPLFLPDGILAGVVTLKGGKRALFKDDVLIESIGGKRIIAKPELLSYELLSDGTIVGTARVEGCERKLLFRDDTLIDRIGGKEFKAVHVSHSVFLGNMLESALASLVGVASLKDERDVPFKGDVLLDEIQGEKVVYVDLPLFLPDGILAGVVTLKGGKRALFKDDVLIESIGGKRIIAKPELLSYELLSDGTIVGTARVEGCERKLLFRDDTLIDRIGGKEFKAVHVSHSVFLGNMLAGEAFLEDGRQVPFVEDKLMDEVHGMKVLEGSFLFQLPNGTPVSFVKLEDGRELLLKGDTLVERIGEKKVVRVVEGCNGFLPDGTLVGAALLEDNKVVFFRGDELLDSIHGEKITGVGYNLRPLPDGTVEGKLEYGGKWDSFFWYGDEVHLSFSS
ncbi:MAG: hypothetical protein FGF51_03095 [Candidatus Brockarchaeota archaeon]|nr:hypothetical protein [Candidatus Brockarchaeota archaeon]